MGRGLFALALTDRFPLLPVEEEGRLGDVALRENFVERVFAYMRWARMLAEEPAPGGLVKFHTAHKLSLMAHGHWTSSVAWHYTEMGRLVADAGNRDWDELTAEYEAMLMEGLGVSGRVSTYDTRSGIGKPWPRRSSITLWSTDAGRASIAVGLVRTERPNRSTVLRVPSTRAFTPAKRP